ncbi:restriction endonuclease subunit S [Streptomyces sp. NPDC057697]|uniref:restriction endonuclease subunit S n=1 Tax=Streptomyces sp. NPDC057697 TaxID=3346219 RepID=UPI003698CBF8
MSDRGEWGEAALSEASTVVMGSSPPGDTYNSLGHGLPFLQGSAEFGEHRPAPVKWCSAPLKVAEPGDLLVSVRAPVGDTNFAVERTAIGRGLAAVSSTDRATTAYLRLAIQDSATELLTRSSPGMFSSITAKALRSFRVPLPPLPAQERIVEVIGAVDGQITALDAEAGALAAVYRAATTLLWRTARGDEAAARPLGEAMRLDIARTPMVAGTVYRLAGVLSAGNGLVDKGEFDGADTEYATMNVLRENQVVMRQLTAWEGPITVVPAEFDGFVASNEFPTFTLAEDIVPGWVRHVCRTPRLWAEMESRVVGTVQRRKRLKPDQLLSVALPVPSRLEQRRTAEALDAIEEQIAVIRDEAAGLRRARAGLLSGLLDRTIDIDSTTE